MPKRSSKRRDTIEIAKSIVHKATGQEKPEEGKNPAAVALGRLGGRKGGKARAKKLTQQQKSELAKKAALARWSDLR